MIFVLKGKCKISIYYFLLNLKCAFLVVLMNPNEQKVWLCYTLSQVSVYLLVTQRPALQSNLHLLYNIISMYHIGDLQILI